MCSDGLTQCWGMLMAVLASEPAICSLQGEFRAEASVCADVQWSRSYVEDA